MTYVAGPAGAPTAEQYRAQARPAGALTVALSYPLAARLCTAAYRYKVRPTALTMANLVLGVAASAGVVLTARLVAADGRWAAAVGVLAWVVWQAAYCADCADGQLARVTAASSPAGGRLDVLCDVAVQVALVGAVAAVAAAATPGAPHWLTAVFAGSWMINMVTSVMAKEGTNVSLVPSSSVAVRAVKLIRDYPAMLTLIAATIAVYPAGMMWVMVLFSAVNGTFLAASIAQAGRASWSGVQQ